MSLIYVVEDNEHLLSDSVQWINNQAHRCHGAMDGPEFDALMATQKSDLVVLDWMLPGEDGLAIAHRLRGNDLTKNIGIIFLTARSDIDDRITGLDIADAYLTKPVDYKELTAVINAVLRRINPDPTEEAVQSWRLSTKRQLIYTPSGNAISLTWREGAILSLLAQNPAAHVSSKAMVSAIQEEWLSFEKNRMEMLLSRLRAKLKDEGSVSVNPIRAIRNKGYQLTLPLLLID